jgi:hypothetical protein
MAMGRSWAVPVAELVVIRSWYEPAGDRGAAAADRPSDDPEKSKSKTSPRTSVDPRGDLED